MKCSQWQNVFRKQQSSSVVPTLWAAEPHGGPQEVVVWNPELKKKNFIAGGCSSSSCFIYYYYYYYYYYHHHHHCDELNVN